MFYAWKIFSQIPHIKVDQKNSICRKIITITITRQKECISSTMIDGQKFVKKKQILVG